VSHIPKIGGSEAGRSIPQTLKHTLEYTNNYSPTLFHFLHGAFIVLVIALATIVIASSVGIYILLRNGEPSTADRAARRKYSIRRRGVRTHPIPIGLPGSLSEKISSVFKGRRAGGGWVPARDDDDGDDDNNDIHGDAREWDATDEPTRERELGRGGDLDDDEEYRRVGVAGASRLTALTLTDATTAGTHKSREATHVDAAAESPADLPVPGPADTANPAAAIPIPAAVVHQVPVRPPSSAPIQVHVPDEEWLDAGRDIRSTVGGGRTDDLSEAARSNPLGYNHAPQPRRADSGQEISLFAGSTPFRDI
jgi:hypothetical protein